jgi:hypothetical protein
MKKRAAGINRREFLAAGGLAAVGLGLPRPAAAAPTAAEKANIDVVNKFLHHRWNVTPIDYALLGQLLAEDCVRGAADPTKNLEVGRETILNNLRSRAGDGAPTRFTYLVQQWACGSIVAHERYEGDGGVGRNGGPASIGHGIGVFHVKDGQIKEWRFYSIENSPDLKIPKTAFKP